MARSIIFAGCVKDDAACVQKVLANFERLSAPYERTFFIFSESDSPGETKALLAQWCGARENAQILSFEGLPARLPRSAERLAFLRNAIMGFITERGLVDYDALCLMDFDDVNEGKILPDGFAAAVDFLFSDAGNAGVFAVSDPVYYDIAALRHEHWCGSDVGEDGRAAPRKPQGGISQADIFDRQVPIERTQPPIAVSSAFGGLALYRLSYSLQATYVGLDPDGDEICEHLSFNKDIKAFGGNLYIFPRMRNSVPWQRCFDGRQQRMMSLSNGGSKIELLAPQSHMLDHYLSNHPLYDRRLPALLSVFNRVSGHASVLDIGANILDTIALMRMSGARLSRSISVDASLEFYKYARFNLEKNRAFFGDSEIVWGFVGREADRGNIVARNGTGDVRNVQRHDTARFLLEPRCLNFSDLAPAGVDLVKTDLDGYDHVVIRQNLAWLKRWKPMLWVEAQIEDRADISAWSNVLLALADDFAHVAVFDNFGFCLCAGTLVDKWNVVLELIGIGARYRANEAKLGPPRFYYLDILFVPRHREDVFREFIGQLPEMADVMPSMDRFEPALEGNDEQVG